MTASFYDISGSLDASSVTAYLRARGWEMMRATELGARWRLKQDDAIRNVAVPAGDADPDSARSMFSAVLATLIEVEQRDVHRIVRDMSEAAYDLLEFRLIADDLQNGEMPLRAAPELTGGALEALQAAARSEVQRRAHYAQGALAASVRAFVDGAVLAGTESGSVILRVRAARSDEPPQGALDGLQPPDAFERRAVARLVAGVKAAKVAVHRDATTVDADALDDDVEAGLSANLCDALVKLSGRGSELDGRLALRVRWALTRPTDEPATEVEIDRGELAQLDRIAAVLKNIQPIHNATVEGPLIRAAKEPGEPEGTVVMRTDIEGKLRTVKMTLEGTDYAIAAAAFVDEKEIRATGTLERAGAVRELTSPTAIERL